MTAEPTDLNVRLVERQPEGLDEAIKRLAAIAQQPAEPQSSVEPVISAVLPLRSFMAFLFLSWLFLIMSYATQFN